MEVYSPMHASRNVLAACTLALFGALPAKAEDLTIVSNLTLKGRTAATSQYIAADRVRASNGDNDTIVEYSTGRMIMIDHRKKEHYETSLAEMTAWLEELSQQMQGNPLGGLLGGKLEEVTVRKGAAPRKIAGYDCDEYILAMGEGMKFEVWAARDLPAPHHYFDAQKAPYAAMGPMGKRFERMFEQMKKIKGFPLATAISAKMMMMKIDSQSEATEVKKGPIPASAFDVPAGYKKKDSPFRSKK